MLRGIRAFEIFICFILIAQACYAAQPVRVELVEPADLGMDKPPAIAPESDLIVADFEDLPNNLGGDIYVYGALEPDWEKIKDPYSWIYEPIIASYEPSNIREGTKSFRLVYGLGPKADMGLSRFSVNLGRIASLSKEPMVIHSKDVRGFMYLLFWVKGQKGNEKFQVNLRDAYAASYEPQYISDIFRASGDWQLVALDLSQAAGKLDLTALVNIGIDFGKAQGNEKGAIIYIDDLKFTNNK